MPGDVIDNQDDSQPVAEAKINKQVVNVPSTAAFSNILIVGIVILSASIGAIVYLVILKK